MNRNAILVAAGAAIVLALGITLILKGKASSGDAQGDKAGKDTVARQKYEELLGRHEETAKKLKDVETERDAAVRDKGELESRMAALEEALRVYREQEEEATAAMAEASSLLVAFGKWKELEAFTETDWLAMGETVETMTKLIVELIEQQKQDLPLDPELQKRVREENNKLIGLAARLMGKLPTQSPINGEFSHPLVLANLMGGMLENTGLPYTPEQKAEIEKLGNAYDEKYEQFQHTYGPETPLLEKMIDELELKRDTMRGIKGRLSPEQQRRLFNEALQDRARVDLLSPALSAIMLAQPENLGSREDARSEFREYVGSKLKLDLNQYPQVDTIFESWYREVEPILQARQDPDLPLHLDEMVVAGRAQVNVMKELLRLPGLDESTRNSIIGDSSWVVPRIAEESE